MERHEILAIMDELKLAGGPAPRAWSGPSVIFEALLTPRREGGVR